LTVPIPPFEKHLFFAQFNLSAPHSSR